MSTKRRNSKTKWDRNPKDLFQKQYITMDGDRYKVILPDYDEAMAIAELAEKHTDMFLGRHAEDPYLCIWRSQTFTGLLPSWRDPDADSIYTLIHEKGKSPTNFKQNRPGVWNIRPLLIPVDKKDRRIDAITDSDGTYVYGGSLYGPNGQPDHRTYFGVNGIASAAHIGDTADCLDENSIIPWVVFKGMLLSRHVLFIGTAEQAWLAGLH